MIRSYEKKDLPRLREIHAASNLPPQCFPDLTINKDGEEIPNPLILHTGVLENDGRIVMSCSLRGTAELYLLVDHDSGTPEELWKWVQEIKEYIAHEAWLLGLDQISAWIPTEVELSFGKRLEDIGFIRSPWSCYTLNLEK